MRHFLARWGTTLIYWSFFITAVTGVLLFYRIHTPPNEQLHTWIGWLMIIAFLFHLARNWRSFWTYFKKPPLYVALLVTLIISGYFAYPSLTGGNGERGREGGRPDFRALTSVTTAMEHAALADLAPIAHTDTAGLMARLNALGVPATDANATLDDVATAAGKNTTTILGALFGRPNRDASRSK